MAGTPASGEMQSREEAAVAGSEPSGVSFPRFPGQAPEVCPLEELMEPSSGEFPGERITFEEHYCPESSIFPPSPASFQGYGSPGTPQSPSGMPTSPTAAAQMFSSIPFSASASSPLWAATARPRQNSVPRTFANRPDRPDTPMHFLGPGAPSPRMSSRLPGAHPNPNAFPPELPSTSASANRPRDPPLRQTSSSTPRGIWLACETTITVCHTTTAVIVFSATTNEHPPVYLCVWLFAYTLACAAALPCLFWRLLNWRRLRREAQAETARALQFGQPQQPEPPSRPERATQQSREPQLPVSSSSRISSSSSSGSRVRSSAVTGGGRGNERITAGAASSSSEISTTPETTSASPEPEPSTAQGAATGLSLEPFVSGGLLESKYPDGSRDAELREVELGLSGRPVETAALHAVVMLDPPTASPPSLLPRAEDASGSREGGIEGRADGVATASAGGTAFSDRPFNPQNAVDATASASGPLVFTEEDMRMESPSRSPDAWIVENLASDTEDDSSLFAQPAGGPGGREQPYAQDWRSNVSRLVFSRRVERVLDRCKLFLDFFFAGWFLLGNIWLIGSASTLAHGAPTLYTLALVFLSFSYVGYGLPFLACATICFWLPCLLAVMPPAPDPDVSFPGRGVSPEVLATLKSFKFKMEARGASGHESRERAGESAMEAREGGADEQWGLLWAGTPQEKRVALEDALCCICLGQYEEGDELRELGCHHHFHVGCVDKWLKINALCPLCKKSLEGGEYSPASPRGIEELFAQSVTVGFLPQRALSGRVEPEGAQGATGMEAGSPGAEQGAGASAAPPAAPRGEDAV